jgi:hypothetical protein
MDVGLGFASTPGEEGRPGQREAERIDAAEYLRTQLQTEALSSF